MGWGRLWLCCSFSLGGDKRQQRYIAERGHWASEAPHCTDWSWTGCWWWTMSPTGWQPSELSWWRTKHLQETTTLLYHIFAFYKPQSDHVCDLYVDLKAWETCHSSPCAHFSFLKKCICIETCPTVPDHFYTRWNPITCWKLWLCWEKIETTFTCWPQIKM